jgi:regulator of replication initiation timing
MSKNPLKDVVKKVLVKGLKAYTNDALELKNKSLFENIENIAISQIKKEMQNTIIKESSSVDIIINIYKGAIKTLFDPVGQSAKKIVDIAYQINDIRQEIEKRAEETKTFKDNVANGKIEPITATKTTYKKLVNTLNPEMKYIAEKYNIKIDLDSSSSKAKPISKERISSMKNDKETNCRI